VIAAGERDPTEERGPTGRHRDGGGRRDGPYERASHLTLPRNVLGRGGLRLDPARDLSRAGWHVQARRRDHKKKQHI
jgi:hypothetical protein